MILTVDALTGLATGVSPASPSFLCGALTHGRIGGHHFRASLARYSRAGDAEARARHVRAPLHTCS